MKPVVLIPYGEMIDGQHNDCVRRLAETGITIITIAGVSAVDLARNILINRALQTTDADIFMWIDSDIIFNPNDVERTCNQLNTSPYDMLGVIYAKRRAGGGVVGETLNPSTCELFTTDDIIPDVHHLGMGFTAIKRPILDRMAKDYGGKCLFPGTEEELTGYPFFLPMLHYNDKTDVRSYYCEDVAFCQRLRTSEGKIGIYTRPRLYHRGLYDYGIEDADRKCPRYDELTLNMVASKK